MFSGLTKIFINRLPKGELNYLTYFFSQTKEQFPYLINPCCGDFSCAYAAIKAGYKPENIKCADTNIFSAIIGAYVIDNKFKNLLFSIKDEESLAYFNNNCRDETEKYAYAIFLIKLAQLHSKQKIYYNHLLNNYLKKKEYEIECIKTSITKIKEKLNGIKYEFNIAKKQCELYGNDENAIVLLNVAGQPKNIDKMFPANNKFYESHYENEVLDDKKDFPLLYDMSNNTKSLYLFYKSENTDDDKKLFAVNGNNIMFERIENRKKIKKYLFVNDNPVNKEKIKNISKYIITKKINTKKKHLPIIPLDYIITENSRVYLIKTNKSESLYYRSIFCKKVSAVAGSTHFIAMIDDYVFGTLAIRCTFSSATRPNPSLFELYGFAYRLKNYPNINRLLMMLITCDDFRKFYKYHIKRNNLTDYNTIRTLCITKYRTQKGNSQLLKLVESKKNKSGLYELVYETPFWKRTFKDCLLDYLWELKNGKIPYDPSYQSNPRKNINA